MVFPHLNGTARSGITGNTISIPRSGVESEKKRKTHKNSQEKNLRTNDLSVDAKAKGIFGPASESRRQFSRLNTNSPHKFGQPIHQDSEICHAEFKKFRTRTIY